jgi:hypothetical protein
MPMQTHYRKPVYWMMALSLLASACILSGNAAAGGVTVIVITATPTTPPDAGGGGPPADTPGSVPTPTLTVIHQVTPPGMSGTTRYITDPESKDYAPQQKANPGADVFAENRYERPFTAETMGYLADVDLKRVEMKIAAPWVYVTFEIEGARSEGIGQTVYGAEFDTDKDGRGEFLVWGVSPAGAEWTVVGVEVWKDSNNDAGGPTPQGADASWSGGNGYDERLFADGQGADPDLAWIRQIEGGAKVQLAFKYSVLGNASQFLWNGLADAGIRNPEWFDYNDHFTAAEAGSPNTYDGDRYPLKALWGVDNTCRDAYGFTPTGSEPGLCLYTGTISGTVFRDYTCCVEPDLSGNGILDPEEPGLSVGQVLLGEGACPLHDFRATAPDSSGRYAFSDIPAGQYCVAFDYINPAITFTTPVAVTVTLAAGEHEVVNFGFITEYACQCH